MYHYTTFFLCYGYTMRPNPTHVDSRLSPIHKPCSSDIISHRSRVQFHSTSIISSRDSGGSTTSEEIVISEGVVVSGGVSGIYGVDGGELGSMTRAEISSGSWLKNVILLCFTLSCDQQSARGAQGQTGI